MISFISKSELLSLRNLLQQTENDNRCIACGLCCKIVGKFFIDLEQTLITEKYNKNLFQSSNKFSVIKHTDFVPWCIGADQNGVRTDLRNNEINIVIPTQNISEIEPSPWFRKMYCKIYDERPILCRYYPYNSFPSYCMIGVDFSGDDPKKQDRFRFLMVKYLFTYRWECLKDINIDYKKWMITKSQGLSISFTSFSSNPKVTHLKSLQHPNSIWNLWGFLKTYKLGNSENNCLESFNGKNSAQEIKNSVALPENYRSWEEFFLYLMILELIEFPKEVLETLLSGLIRF